MWVKVDGQTGSSQRRDKLDDNTGPLSHEGSGFTTRAEKKWEHRSECDEGEVAECSVSDSFWCLVGICSCFLLLLVMWMCFLCVGSYSYTSTPHRISVTRLWVTHFESRVQLKEEERAFNWTWLINYEACLWLTNSRFCPQCVVWSNRPQKNTKNDSIYHEDREGQNLIPSDVDCWLCGDWFAWLAPPIMQHDCRKNTIHRFLPTICQM